jgi:hypothetical protein
MSLRSDGAKSPFWISEDDEEERIERYAKPDTPSQSGPDNSNSIEGSTLSLERRHCVVDPSTEDKQHQMTISTKTRKLKIHKHRT